MQNIFRSSLLVALFVACANASVSAQTETTDNVVWRETYDIEYSKLNDAMSKNQEAETQSRFFLDEKRLYVFPVQNPPAPNQSVILLKEDAAETGEIVPNDHAQNNDDLRVSLRKHAAMNPQNELTTSRETTSEEWLRQLGHTPTRDEIGAFRKSRHRPTSRGVWLFRETQEDSFARFASESQYQIILAEGLWMASQGRNGRRAAWRGFAATAVTGALTVAVKKTWRRRRPYPNDQKFGTFPSGHTSTVFAMATVMANASPRHKWLAYSSAAAVGWSRIKVRAHHPHDVIAGALLGYYVGKKFAPRDGEKIHAPIANINFKF